MDILDMVKKVTPWIGAAASGNVPGLIAMAASAVAGVTGADVSATPTGIAEAVAGIKDPAILIQLKNADNDFALKMKQAGFSHEEEIGRLGLEEDKLTVADVSDARKNNSGNEQLWVIAWLVLITFALGMAAVLYGCYALLTGGITIKDVAVVAAVSGLVGSIVGYLAANAQTVINFLFGGSLGSRNQSTALSQSVQRSIEQLAAK